MIDNECLPPRETVSDTTVQQNEIGKPASGIEPANTADYGLTLGPPTGKHSETF